MTIQMREGWVRCRDGLVDYAEPNAGSWQETHPWRLRKAFLTIRNDGQWTVRGDNSHDRDVVELLDPWDERIDEKHREKRFVIATAVVSWRTECRTVGVFDREKKQFLSIGADCDEQRGRAMEYACRVADGEFTSIHFTDQFTDLRIEGSPLAKADEMTAEAAVPTNDPVNHPPHYTQHPSGVECIQVTQHMNFCLGNAMKYIWRADLKHDAIEDLRKAAWYINREIERRESQQ